jgi:small GTP-binding protein
MADDFKYDVFLSHSSKDKDVVRDVAERLRADGLRVWFDSWEIKPSDQWQAKIEEGLDQSRVLVLCMSANAFGSEWAQLEAGTFRFRDPLNKDRRLIFLRLDDLPIRDSLAGSLYIYWRSEVREPAYSLLLGACQPLAKPTMTARGQVAEKAIQLNYQGAEIRAYAFSPDGKRALTGAKDYTVRLWDVEAGQCLRVLEGHTNDVERVMWSTDQRRVLSGSADKTLRLWDVETGLCLRVLKGHIGFVRSVAWSADQRRAVSAGGKDNTVRVWDLETGRCLRVLEGHTGGVWSVAWSADQNRALSGSQDNTVRMWDVETGRCLHVLKGHAGLVRGVAWSADGHRALSGSGDKTVRLWDVETGRCLRVLEGHTKTVGSMAWSADDRRALSGSSEKTVRLWDVETGHCLRVLEGHTSGVRSVSWSADQRRAFSGDNKGGIRVWDLSEFVTEARASQAPARALAAAPDQVQYTNAKVLVVGDTSAGKTGLAHRLATGEWKPSDGSTVGAWSTQWQLPELSTTKTAEGLEQEIWLWDFGGQADQRLVHQLYMDRAALILLLFDADKEDVLPGLREWQTALRRCVPVETPLLLVAGRIDAGFRASRAKLQSFANEHGFRYFETSAKEGTNCKELSRAITEVIPWGQMEKRTSPRIFKLIKDEILKLRDEGQVLDTFKELREVLWQRMPEEPRFTDETLKTVISLLDGPGVVKELDYGTYVLLQPEWINAYAQAVIRTLRQEPSELGALPLRSIEEGKLLFQTVERDGAIVNMKRLPEAEERVVLREMERQLEERGLCLRQSDKLVFPSHCGRERPEKLEYPSVFVSYAVQGYLDDLYATLVVKLADCESFKLAELWRDAADFETLKGDHHMGIKLTREAAGSGDISVYFAPGVTIQEQVIFANYIHAHLQGRSEQVQRLRYYVCPFCGTPKGNPQVMMKKLLAKKKAADVECDICEKRFGLWDDLEILFASDDVRKEVEGLQAIDTIRLDSRRKGKLLALEVSSRITSADQKCFEIPGTEDEGIDMELEFTDDNGKGTGKRLYLQLKSGNSHLRKRKDEVEIFAIKDQRWVDYWMKQSHPVMLVIGTFAQDDERSMGSPKLEFDEVRWMEISSYLKRESQNGKKPVKQIEFKGERLDMTSVRRWRDKALN